MDEGCKCLENTFYDMARKTQGLYHEVEKFIVENQKGYLEKLLAINPVYFGEQVISVFPSELFANLKEYVTAQDCWSGKCWHNTGGSSSSFKEELRLAVKATETYKGVFAKETQKKYRQMPEIGKSSRNNLHEAIETLADLSAYAEAAFTGLESAARYQVLANTGFVRQTERLREN